jgi:hypothetical protein
VDRSELTGRAEATRSSEAEGRPLMHRHAVSHQHRDAAARVGRFARPRRGVASVLAMMFLVIFGSLAAAMAVVAQGNLRTADSSIKVSRAMSAAETGMSFAARRLFQESRRFIVEKGVIDADFADDLWSGTLPSGEVVVLDPNGYEPPGPPPPGIIQAIRDAHLVDQHAIIVEPGDSDLPDLDEATGILRVRPIALDDGAHAPYFRLTYALIDGEPLVRVTSVGVDGDIARTLQMDFRLEKKIEYAVLSPNRIMIGKNVMLEGPVGSLFGTPDPAELETDNGDPLVMRSDFYYLADALDTNLDTLYAEIVDKDVDGDARLRPEHPTEGTAMAGHPELVDYDGNEYVDDFDLFLAHFDTNDDGMVAYDAALAAAAGLGVLAEEFTDVDEQLARLIDEAMSDRDGDGASATATDTALGYRDGVVDSFDLYAKVTGRLAFACVRADWETANGADYQTIVEGPMRPGLDRAAVSFEVAEEDLLAITTDMLDSSQSWFEAQVPGPTAVAIDDPPQDPATLAGLAEVAGTYTAPTDWEEVPFGSVGAYDYYQRPHYENMTFRNTRIPRGNNGLFENCTFVGVTYVEAYADCDHHDWNYAGAMKPADGGGFELRFPDLPPQADIDAGEIIADTRLVSNNIRFHNCTFLGSLSGDQLGEYTHWRNKIQMTGNTRFYIDPADPEMLAQPDGATLATLLSSLTPEDRVELRKSSILMPGWSVDVGNFTNEQAVNPDETPSINLKGTMIAGILDVRGTANVEGTLLMTFKPIEGAGPLYYGGQPDAFNTTIGYFGPADGDDEGSDPSDPDFNGFGEIRLRYDPDALLPDGIPWPVQIKPEPFSYVEGGGS